VHFVDVETEGEATGEAGKPTATTKEFQLRFINTDMSDSPTILGGYRAWSNIPTTSSDLRSNTLERFEPPTCRSLWLEPRYIRRSEQNDILDSNGPFRSAPKLQLAAGISRLWPWESSTSSSAVSMSLFIVNRAYSSAALVWIRILVARAADYVACTMRSLRSS
jgi:hypothetical protein